MQILAPIGYPDAPSVATLRSWSVFAIRDDDGQLVHVAMGLLNDREHCMRITSRIARGEGGQILTDSGSIYTLLGPSATALELENQASRRQALLGPREAVDVTARYRGTI